MIWWILLYITGFGVAYFIIKKELQRTEWTVGDRIIALFMALFSWLGLIAMGIASLLSKINWNKPAKW